VECFTHEKIDIIFERGKENLNKDTGISGSKAILMVESA